MKFNDPVESKPACKRTLSQDSYDSDEEIFEKTFPVVEASNMCAVESLSRTDLQDDCQGSQSSADGSDDEEGVINKAKRGRMKFPPADPSKATSPKCCSGSNESNNLHKYDHCSNQDGSETKAVHQVLGTVDEKKSSSSKDCDQQQTSSEMEGKEINVVHMANHIISVADVIRAPMRFPGKEKSQGNGTPHSPQLTRRTGNQSDQLPGRERDVMADRVCGK